MEDLREALKRGGKDAFRALVDQYGGRLYNAGLALCGNPTDAQDFVQETFTEALQALSRFEGRSAPYTWLYGILRRRFLLSCRKKTRFLRILPLFGRETPGMKSDDAGEAFCAPDDLMAAVLKLSPKYREVLFLRYMEILSVAEIAALTAVPEGTVKSRLHHAHRRLRAILGSEAGRADLRVAEKADEL